jgi:hypothetical protein
MTDLTNDLSALADGVNVKTLREMYLKTLEYVPVSAMNELYYNILDVVEVEVDADNEPWDGFRDDVEADADVLANVGWGTDEDYGYYGD